MPSPSEILAGGASVSLGADDTDLQKKLRKAKADLALFGKVIQATGATLMPFTKMLSGIDAIGKGIQAAGREVMGFGHTLMGVGTNFIGVGAAIVAPLVYASREFATMGSEMRAL